MEHAGRRVTGGLGGRLATLMQHAVEVPTAALVLVEISVLLAGVVSRFVFHHPFTWSDELASILFLWLAMFGAVVALQRGQHMRLTAIVAALGPKWQGRAEALAILVPMVFLLVLLPQAWDFAADERFIETPALGLPNIVRAAALPVGFALMLAECAIRLLRCRWVHVLQVAVVLVVLGSSCISRRRC